MVPAESTFPLRITQVSDETSLSSEVREARSKYVSMVARHDRPKASGKDPDKSPFLPLKGKASDKVLVDLPLHQKDVGYRETLQPIQRLLSQKSWNL